MSKEFYGKPVMEVIELVDDAIRTSGGQEVCLDTGCAPVAVCPDGGCAPVAVCSSDCLGDGVCWLYKNDGGYSPITVCGAVRC